jgi:hypothetical protein
MGIIGIDSSIHQQIIENTSKVKSSRYSWSNWIWNLQF